MRENYVHLWRLEKDGVGPVVGEALDAIIDGGPVREAIMRILSDQTLQCIVWGREERRPFLGPDEDLAGLRSACVAPGFGWLGGLLALEDYWGAAFGPLLAQGYVPVCWRAPRRDVIVSGDQAVFRLAASIRPVGPNALGAAVVEMLTTGG